MDAHPGKEHMKQNLAIAYNVKKQAMKKKMAKGGMAENPDLMESHMEPEEMSMADMIMMRRKAKKMMEESDMKKAENFADGGEVDLDENAMEEPNSYYHQNEEAALKENYDEDMDHLHQDMDSNEHGRTLPDEDEYDMVSAVRKRMKMKGMK